LDPEEHNIPHKPSNKGTINEGVDFEIESIAAPSDQPKGVVKTVDEGSVPTTNPPFYGPYNPLLVEFPSTRYIDNFSSYRLPPDMYSRKYSGIHA